MKNFMKNIDKRNLVSVIGCALIAVLFTLFVNINQSQNQKETDKNDDKIASDQDYQRAKHHLFEESNVIYFKEDLSQTNSEDKAEKILIEANDNFDLDVQSSEKAYFAIDLFEKTISFTNENFEPIAVSYTYELQHVKAQIQIDCGELETSQNLIAQAGDRFPESAHYVIAEIANRDGQKVIRPVALKSEEIENLEKDEAGRIIPGQKINPAG